VGKSTAELLNQALVYFGQAIAGPVAEPYASLARVGTARAHLGLGNYAAAAASVAEVASGFAFNTIHSAVSGEENMVFLLNTQQRRLTLTDAEGVNGLPFRSAADPRVPWVAAGVGFNFVTPQFNLLKYPSASSPITIASGTEARLIEAEAALQASNVAGFLATVNGLRATAGLPVVVDPGTPSSRVDVLFRERAFWLFATGERLGDLRRLVNRYGRAPSTMFPTGPYPGGSYGTDANLPVPSAARGQSYVGCTNRAG
jgi:starch-binding outer membrane protein, SusD/RagB family